MKALEIIQQDDTWQITDSSKLKAYMSCPRKYFYRYILGWDMDTPNLHLIYGSAWHAGMEVLMKEGLTPETGSKAFEEFIKVYEEYYTELDWENNKSKTPGNAMKAYASYISKYRLEDTFKVHFTEVFGSVMIDPDDSTRKLSFKIDAIVEDTRGLYIMEHKTTGNKSEAYMTNFSTDIQPAVYYHALKSMIAKLDIRKPVFGVVINASYLGPRRKDSDCMIEHFRVPVTYRPEMMQLFCEEILYYMDEIQWNFGKLEESSDNDSTMIAFPRRPTACAEFNTICPYHIYCSVWNNPLQSCHEVPIGFIRNFWNPLSLNKSGKETVEV